MAPGAASDPEWAILLPATTVDRAHGEALRRIALRIYPLHSAQTMSAEPFGLWRLCFRLLLARRSLARKDVNGQALTGYCRAAWEFRIFPSGDAPQTQHSSDNPLAGKMRLDTSGASWDLFAGISIAPDFASHARSGCVRTPWMNRVPVTATRPRMGPRITKTPLTCPRIRGLLSLPPKCYLRMGRGQHAIGQLRPPTLQAIRLLWMMSLYIRPVPIPRNTPALLRQTAPPRPVAHIRICRWRSILAKVTWPSVAAFAFFPSLNNRSWALAPLFRPRRTVRMRFRTQRWAGPLAGYCIQRVIFTSLPRNPLRALPPDDSPPTTCACAAPAISPLLPLRPTVRRGYPRETFEG